MQKKQIKLNPFVKSKENGKGTPKKSNQKFFIANVEIEKWFTHYKGEHNNNSAKKLNEVTVRYGTETVIKAIHNALDGVNIDINRSYIKQIE
ncbi:hypothetical protein QUF79_13095 [Fictibacillus enclensis]|uniref:hypothetical protein n=1 Tax=Fictibacillus enclensis TaxID=1017270 RepID=UPI0025A10BE0|nr:hypothetical protein [Fictibacillus enclensis]MDM5198960.1 hypothetical protein [Fictibacillus enclensis]